MSTLGRLPEYLLALEMPNGDRIARYGILGFTSIYPPEQSIAFDLYPAYDAYANIFFFHRQSPNIVPDALRLDSWQRGIEVSQGALGSVDTVESHNLWVEITNAEPAHTVVTNLTPLNQREDFLDAFLIVETSEHYKRLKHAISHLSETTGIEEKLGITNSLLRAIARATPGVLIE